MNQPLQLGLWSRSRIRLIRQTESAECGLAALAMICNYHGRDLDLTTLRRQFVPSARGVGLANLISIADRLGFSSRPVKLELEDLASLQLPALLHWDLSHFVVVERVRRNKALIHNPAGFSRWYRLDRISDHFTGVALELFPAEDFERTGRRERVKLAQMWRRVTGLKRALLQIAVLSLVMQICVLASPYYMQVAIDTALPAHDEDLLIVLALGFGMLTIVNASASLLRSFVILAAGTSMSYGLAANIARRLFRLPVVWFEKRHVGDILSRFQSIMPIQLALTQGTVAALIDGVLAIVLLLVMLFYSVLLTAVAVSAGLLYALARLVSFSLQREAQESAIVLHAKEQSVLMESIRGIVPLRLFNREGARHTLWQARMAEAINADVELARVGIWQQTANALILGIEIVVSIWLAVSLVMAGGFSVGMVFAYMAYKTQFLTRTASLVDQSISFRMLGLHLERLADIATADQDVSFAEQPRTKLTLKGRVELRGIQFRYSPSDPLVLDGVDLVIQAGEHVAITGPSGGGKTTLVKVIVGLLQPGEGEVLIDGVPLATFGYKNFHDQIAAVLQDDTLFAGSLANNIALFDDNVDMERVVEAASAAAIHDDIMQMPMAYETPVADMATSLSGGQKQRVLLARALYRQPRLLLMDEGTSHLDVRTESLVNAAISAMGITRIIVAHRLETISAADRFVTLANGTLHDQRPPGA